jgi:sister-chromatid-cohesion protein PDS5
MSTSNPAVFKANVKALSDLLQEQSSSKSQGATNSGAVDTLRACAGFAKSYPKDMPQERKLLQALVSFALTGKPPAAAKHAVSILMYSANRKEMYAADLLRRCIKDFQFGAPHFLTKLACLAQLVLLAPEQCEEESKAITAIARDVIFNTRTPAVEEATEASKEWVDDDQLDDECKAKLLALKILVNRLRSGTEVETVKKIAGTVMKLLIKLVNNEGELSAEKNTPFVTFCFPKKE